MSSLITWFQHNSGPRHAGFTVGPGSPPGTAKKDTAITSYVVVRILGPAGRLTPEDLAEYLHATTGLTEALLGKVETVGLEIQGHADLLSTLTSFRGIREFDVRSLQLAFVGHHAIGESEADCAARLLTSAIRASGAESLHVHDEGLALAIARITDGPDLVSSPAEGPPSDHELPHEPALAPIGTGNITLHVDPRERLNYAMVGAGIPLIRAITLANNGDVAMRDLVISITVLSSQSDKPIAAKTVQLSELAPRASETWSRPELEFDARALVVLDESTAGSIVVKVRHGETQLAIQNVPIRLLAYNQWSWIKGAVELLAAHVLPNHPIIEDVRSRASEITKSSTGRSSQEGYQAGEKRAIEIARSNYLALRERKIRYCDPPAGFEQGQKIRTPDQVLGDRFGTCLDTTCLLAACLEQSGLHPVLFLVEGHAFAGVWLDENRRMPEAFVQQSESVRNAVDTGLLWPIETTFLTEDHDRDFDDAVAEGKKRLASIPLLGAVDVRVARQQNVRPLPSRTVQNGQTVVVQQLGPAATGPTIVAGERRFQAPKGNQVSPAPKRMQRWKEDLLDLSLRNPLLHLKLGRGGGLKIITPSKSLHEIESLLAADEGLSLVAEDQVTELQKQRGVRLAQAMHDEALRQAFTERRTLFVGVEEAKLRTSARRLMTQARAIEEESGSNVLHLTLGTLVWTDPDKDKEVRSPLIVLPVRLHAQARGKPLQLTADLNSGGTAVNQCLLQKLRTTFRLEVPALATWRGDTEGADLRTAIDAMRKTIQQEGLAMSIEEDACLCLLHFGKFRMWKDLDEHWEKILEQPVVRHLVENAGATFVNRVALPTRTELETAEVHCPIPCDGSQLEAVVAAARGCSFVLEGPPGTGKSQTITNLIANALAAGKRVLFVAEKRAALEVVKSRLHRVGLGFFCLDIHGKATTTTQLREQLRRSLEAPLGVDRRAWEQGRRELSHTTDHLRRYAQAVHAPNQVGQSLWRAYQEVLLHGDGPRFAIANTLFAAGVQAVADLREQLRALPEVASTANLRPQHPWLLAEATTTASIDTSQLAAAVDMVAKAFQPTSSRAQSALALLSAITGTEQLASLQAILTASAQGCRFSLEALQRPPSSATIDALRKHADSIEAQQRDRAIILEAFLPSIFGEELNALLVQARNSQNAFFLWRKGRIRAAHAKLQPFLRGVSLSFDMLVDYLEKAQSLRGAVIRTESAIRALHLPCLPAGWEASDDNAGAALRALAHAFALAPHLSRGALAPLLQAALANASETTDIFTATSARLNAWIDLTTAIGASEASIAKWRNQRSLEDAVVASLPAWQRDAQRSTFLELNRWIQLQHCLGIVRKAGMPDLADEVLSCQLDARQALVAFDRSLANHSLEERLATLQLQRFDGLAHANHVRAFLRLRDADSEALKAMVPDKLVDSRPFRPGQRMGQIAELDRKELSRQKGGRSIRTLLETYSEAVITLMPCVLASPDSVAQFLAPGGIDFDLVVFDEASQVPVADAVGAIGRGKALVVVGDSRQMPPTAFFGRTGNADDDQDESTDDVPPDMESVLSEAVASGLPRIWLSWHYRSQDESLIAFSNRFYYDNRLASFPTPATRAANKGVHLLRVEGGVFDSGKTRTNSREVAAVVAEVRRRLADPVEQRRSIGVVALNLQQAELLQEALEDAALVDPALDAVLRDESENHLFVKNLESVQGDERDVILISLTYAPNRQGQFLMNFGPLNRIGGERRWNVLVTRARQEVVLVSSIAPEDIKLERVSSLAKGVAHMRAYLAMAQDGIERSHEMQIGPVEPVDLHRDQVAERLRKMGLHVEVGVGLSTFRVDIAVAHPDSPNERLVAILLDGPGYAARPTVQDRDGLPAAVLHDLMGWPRVVRVWLPQWINEEDRVLAEIRAAVEEARPQPVPHAAPLAARVDQADHAAKALSGERSRSAESSHGPIELRHTAPIAPTASTEPVALRSHAPVTRDPEDMDFKPYSGGPALGQKEDIDAKASGVVRARILQAIQEVLVVEAPIESTRLAKLVARRFGLLRAREDRIQVIIDQVPRQLVRCSDFGDFVWPTGIQPDSWRCFRRPIDGDAPRDFMKEIPPEEVRNALCYAAVKGLGLSEDGAIDEIARVFGIGRVSQQMRTRMIGILEWSISTGRLQRDAKGRIVVTG
jgi:hypothetical protein